MGGKKLTELIIEGKKSAVLDNLPEPLLFLDDDDLSRLNQAVNILVVNRGYRVLNISQGFGHYTVCLEKKWIRKVFEVRGFDTAEEATTALEESNQGELIGRRGREYDNE
jgi:hypothetical protein